MLLKEFITNNDVNDNNKESNDNNVPTPVTTTANPPSSLNFLPNKKQAIGIFNPVSKPRVVAQKDSMEKPQNVQAPTFFPPANMNNKDKQTDFIELINQVVLLDNKTQYKYLVSLIECGGFDINTPIFEGKTALHLGVLHNHYHLVDVLLKNGADRAIQDNDNKTIQDYYNENPKAHELLDAFFKPGMILN
ncbi:TPA: hypothetical protein ACP9DH_002900 [Legionella anisa]